MSDAIVTLSRLIARLISGLLRNITKSCLLIGTIFFCTFFGTGLMIRFMFSSPHLARID
jgi:hypothetical protein